MGLGCGFGAAKTAVGAEPLQWPRIETAHNLTSDFWNKKW